MEETTSKTSAREKLLNAAFRVIRAQGYSATTVDDLCREAGVTKGAFFHHFKTKDELAIAAADHWSEVTGALFEGAPYHQPSDPLERVLGYIDFRRAILQGSVPEFTCLVGTMVQETFDTNPGIRDACAASITGHAATLEADITEAMELHGVDGPWTATSLALHTQAVLQGAFILAKATGETAVAADSLDHLRRYVEFLFHRALDRDHQHDSQSRTLPRREGEVGPMSPVSRSVWYDVMTTDTAAARAFYAHVVGWRTQDSGTPGADYTLLMDGDDRVGGLMPIPPDAAAAGTQPAWMGYVGVADVDAKAKELERAGGAVHRPPSDIPGVGRFAVVSDPHGAGFILFQPNDGQEAAPAPFMKEKHIGWHELHAGDREEAFAFYQKLFGWTKAEKHDMGGGLIYQTFATGAETIGGIMTNQDEEKPPHWAFYVSVPDIDAAAQRVRDRGGVLLTEPEEVPGGVWAFHAEDPQGAHFTLIGPRAAKSQSKSKAKKGTDR